MSPSATWPAEGHPGEALSGFVDGELGAEEREAVVAHVERCPRCADELRGLRAVRAAIRALPPVEPPAGLLDRLVADLARAVGPRRERTRRSALVAVAAVVAAVLLVPSITRLGPYRPEIQRALLRHASSVSALSAVGSTTADGGPAPLTPPVRVTPSTAPPRAVDDLPPPYRAPAELAGGYQLVHAFSHPDGLQLVYERGRYGLSVFQTPAELDRAGLAPGAQLVVDRPAPTWRWQADGVAGRVVVVDGDGVVVTAVGDEPGDAVLSAVRSLPDGRSPSAVQRLRRAAAQVLRAISPSWEPLPRPGAA